MHTLGTTFMVEIVMKLHLVGQSCLAACCHDSCLPACCLNAAVASLQDCLQNTVDCLSLAVCQCPSPPLKAPEKANCSKEVTTIDVSCSNTKDPPGGGCCDRSGRLLIALYMTVTGLLNRAG